MQIECRGPTDTQRIIVANSSYQVKSIDGQASWEESHTAPTSHYIPKGRDGKKMQI
jgi:hypothetical protein